MLVVRLCMIIILARGKSKFDIILPSWHESIDNDDGFIYLLVDPNESSRPSRTIDGDGQTIRKGVRDERGFSRKIGETERG